MLPAGDYRLSTDEGQIEGLSFPIYRQMAELEVAQERDVADTASKPTS